MDNYLGEKEVLHSDFLEYCKERSLGLLNDVYFGKRLAKFGIIDKKKGPKGNQKHYWIGLRLKVKPVDG